MLRYGSFYVWVVSFFLLQSCASTSYEIPEPLEVEIEKNLSFREISEAPDLHKGKLVQLGGEVLHAQSLKEGTQLEVLQLPLDHWQRPENQRTASTGRFLAVNETFIDPATFTPNTRVTIVGRITGSRVAPLDEMEYRYPTVMIQHLHIWEDSSDTSSRQNGPHWSIFGGGGTGIRTGGGVSIGIGF